MAIKVLVHPGIMTGIKGARGFLPVSKIPCQRPRIRTGDGTLVKMIQGSKGFRDYRPQTGEMKGEVRISLEYRTFTAEKE
jgi:hypothetical protein